MEFEKLLEQELEIITEVTAKRGRRVRGGKVVKKRKCAKGYKLKGGRTCVRQKAKERITRRRAGRKSARKGKSARRRNFKKSIRLRQRRKLKRSR